MTISALNLDHLVTGQIRAFDDLGVCVWVCMCVCVWVCGCVGVWVCIMSYRYMRTSICVMHVEELNMVT